MSEPIHDAVVVGGGPVGCAAAIAMTDAGMNVAVLEAHADSQRAPDSRTLALSWNSRLILQRLGVWSDDLPATAINTIHVSHRGHFGRACLNASDLRLPALGYVLRFSDLHAALRTEARAREIDYRSGFKVRAVRPGAPYSEVSGTSASGEESLQSRLVVIADGGASLSKSPTQRTRDHDYGQVAVVGLVESDRLHRNCAYERFTATGPIALLPCDDEFAFVWTCTPERAKQLLSLNDTAFVHELRSAFGDRAGRFISTRLRSSFPLILRVVRQPHEAGVVLLGNASQTLHPIAGQGFNLGLRDAWDLADVIRTAPVDTLGSAPVTSQFRKQRRSDRFAAITFTHSLAKLFSSDFTPLAIGRGIGLVMLDTLPPLKRDLMRRMIFGTTT
ncbi:MAG: FAD-dependent monooxygenase [Betaproteobacteria bacterium]|nr:MAG: FAD-dependent monooxygenase [Betaproteobacteria bacterium]